MLRFDPMKPYENNNFYRNKHIHELNVHELAYIHLDTLHGSATLKDVMLFSSLNGLKENLSASYNNIRTGQYTPLLTSFAILDQLGNIYSNLSKVQPKTSNGIKMCLKNFSKLSNDDINSVVMLRNGLYHDGSLVAERKYPNQPFVIYRTTTITNMLITHPKTAWDGVYSDSLEYCISKINIDILKDVVIEVCHECFDLLKNGKLTIKITNPAEFYYKYLFAL